MSGATFEAGATVTNAGLHNFEYEALDAAGVLAAGVVVADTTSAAHAILNGRGLLPVDLRIATRGTITRTPMATNDLAIGLRILADLLEAGLPIARALHAFNDLAPPGWHAALPHIEKSVREGMSFAAALASAPVTIPSLVVGIAYAGEAGSGIAAAIRRAAELTESKAAIRAAVQAALLYPLVLALAGSASIALMVGVVLPRFAAILSDIGQTLPAFTQLVIDVANTTRAAFLPAAVLCVVCGVIGRAYIATSGGGRHWSRLLLQLPLVGDVRAAAATAHAALSLATLLESGVPMRRALVFAARASGDAEIEARILQARERIGTGQRLATAFGETAAFTSTALRLVAAGDESGRLSSMLTHATKLEQERSDRRTRAAVRLLEPALILLFASIVGIIAAALLQAVYSVRPTV